MVPTLQHGDTTPRAYTGRDLVAVCADHPFFSADDWFIGTTPMSAGIPKVVQELTLKFNYNSIESIQALFRQYPGQIACLIMEPEKETAPVNDFLHTAQNLCRDNGTVFILDEMICGFRWHLGGGQRYHRIVPDLSTFGKALGTFRFPCRQRELMGTEGWTTRPGKNFLLSLT